MSATVHKTANFGKAKAGLATVGYTVSGVRHTAGVTEYTASRSPTDGAMTATSAVLTSATAKFAAYDAGKSITVNGAGAAGGNLVTTIASYQSATQVTLAAAASTTVSGATFTFLDNTGVYEADVTVADGFTGSIVWDTGDGTPSYAPDEINLVDTPGVTTITGRLPNLAVSGTVAASPSPTQTSFAVNGLATAVSYAGKKLHFTSGNNLAFDIAIATDSGGSPRTLTFASPGWQVAPAAGDTFVIFG